MREVYVCVCACVLCVGEKRKEKRRDVRYGVLRRESQLIFLRERERGVFVGDASNAPFVVCFKLIPTNSLLFFRLKALIQVGFLKKEGFWSFYMNEMRLCEFL